jgi:hypothetical protein
MKEQAGFRGIDTQYIRLKETHLCKDSMHSGSTPRRYIGKQSLEFICCLLRSALATELLRQQNVCIAAAMLLS